MEDSEATRGARLPVKVLQSPNSTTDASKTLQGKIEALMEVCRLRGIAYAQSLNKSVVMGYDLEAIKLKEDILRMWND